MWAAANRRARDGSSGSPDLVRALPTVEPERPGRLGLRAPGLPSGPRRPRVVPLSRAARRRRRSRRGARAFLVLVLASVLGLTSFLGGLLAAPFDVKSVPPAPKPVQLLAADGTPFAEIRPVERRELMRSDQIPDVMREAIISAEDARFLDHGGVDPIATIRAAYRDIVGGRRQGGSTITQQYVKNTYVGKDRTLLRKVREAAIAVRLEQRKSKQDILTDYLNVLYLGNQTYGVQAASKYYFGVPVTALALDETPGREGMPPDTNLALARAAMLAGIAPAPTDYNPVRNFALARTRQKYTLNQMVINRYITTEDASSAYKRQAAVMPKKESPPELPSSAPEYADLVKAQLKAKYADDPDVLDRGGLKVRTALDTDLQSAISRAVREVLPSPTDPEAAVVAFDITNGDVKAMTTLRRYPEQDLGNGKAPRPAVQGYKRGGYNLATNAYRSTGSTIKPFTLAAALEKGLTLDTTRRAPGCDTIPDRFAVGGAYHYCNAAGEGSGGYGYLTLRRALQGSVNTVFVPLALDVGRPRIKQLMLDSGAKASAPTRDDPNPFATNVTSFGLGTTALVTPLSMGNAFGTLLNHGEHMAPRYITETRDASGAVLDKAPAKPQPQNRAMPADIADQVVTAMSGVTKPGGTAPAAAQDFLVYGKTGTTDDSTDAWFIGCSYSPQNLCIATWMGYDDQNSCKGISDGACGGMKGIEGVPQVYGGTLPAKVYSRTIAILRDIQAGKRAAQAGSPAPSGGPAAGPGVAPSAAPSFVPRRRRYPTGQPVRPFVPAPAPVTSPALPVAPAPAPSRAPRASPAAPAGGGGAPAPSPG